MEIDPENEIFELRLSPEPVVKTETDTIKGSATVFVCCAVWSCLFIALFAQNRCAPCLNAQAAQNVLHHLVVCNDLVYFQVIDISNDATDTEVENEVQNGFSISVDPFIYIGIGRR